ncbi:VanZ family protein [Bacillus sp. AFS041924]|uniref:VanZ family protein n=1 Tax=Bacillus sp. AFS041924 TaxID=2033503 RepID=UPI000BFC5793|nr:VanZ family protein [Bacillus sp. AFS041924]PGS49155.1 hypothetical protein COC46_15720 [Bacillus sp. AFS041924]
MRNITRKHQFIFYWLPVFIIAGVIFYSSSTPYGDQDIRPQLNYFSKLSNFIGLFDFVQITYAGKVISIETVGTAGFAEFIIRKLAHFTIFLCLAFFTTRLVRIYYKHYFITGLLLTVLYAASDEFHQSFTADRTPLMQDVLIDSAGAIVGACLYVIIFKSRILKRKQM